jgi:hypothetical protein
VAGCAAPYESRAQLSSAQQFKHEVHAVTALHDGHEQLVLVVTDASLTGIPCSGAMEGYSASCSVHQLHQLNRALPLALEGLRAVRYVTDIRYPAHPTAAKKVS